MAEAPLSILRGIDERANAAYGRGGGAPTPASPDLTAGAPASPSGPKEKNIFGKTWEKTKEGGGWLVDALWKKEDVRASLLTGTTLSLIRAGLNWGTGGMGLGLSIGFGAVGGGIKAAQSEIYRQATDRKAQLEEKVRLAPVTVTKEDSDRLDELREAKIWSIKAKFRAAEDKKQIAKAAFRGLWWGAVGAAIGVELSKFDLAGLLNEHRDALLQRHDGAKFGFLAGGLAGSTERLVKAVRLKSGEKFSFKKMGAIVVGSAVAGALLGEGIEQVVKSVGIKFPGTETPSVKPADQPVGVTGSGEAAKPAVAAPAEKLGVVAPAGGEQAAVPGAGQVDSPPGSMAEVMRPEAKTMVSPDADLGAKTEDLTKLRDTEVHALTEYRGAQDYAKELWGVLNDPNNTEKLNPFDNNLPPVTEEGVKAAVYDANIKLYELDQSGSRLVDHAWEIKTPGNMDSLNATAQKEFGEYQGAQAYADSLKPGDVGANGNVISIEDVRAAHEEAKNQFEQAQSAIRNSELIQNSDSRRWVPQLPEEVRGLPNFFDQEISVKPGSSFWDSWDIKHGYFASDLEDGWINPANGVTQEDVVKGMIKQFAEENGHPLDKIPAGTIKLSDLDLTDEQKAAIRKALATNSVSNYQDQGVKAFRTALKRAA